MENRKRVNSGNEKKLGNENGKNEVRIRFLHWRWMDILEPNIGE